MLGIRTLHEVSATVDSFGYITVTIRPFPFHRSEVIKAKIESIHGIYLVSPYRDYFRVYVANNLFDAKEIARQIEQTIKLVLDDQLPFTVRVNVRRFVLLQLVG